MSADAIRSGRSSRFARVLVIGAVVTGAGLGLAACGDKAPKDPAMSGSMSPSSSSSMEKTDKMEKMEK